MNWRQMIISRISDISAIARRYSKPRKGLRILLYHAVGTPIKEDLRNLFTISPKLFESHMAELAKYKDISIIGLTDSNTEQGNRVAVTFDDGYKDNLTVAMPILSKYQIPFHIFVTTSFIKKGEFPFLNRSELRSLSDNSLVTIGSHGASHIPLTECNDNQLRHELESSKRYLEDITGKEITAISYPHGRINRRVLDAVANAGYKIGASSHFNINCSPQDSLMLCRTSIFGSDSVRVFRQKMHGDWDWYSWRHLLSEMKAR